MFFKFQNLTIFRADIKPFKWVGFMPKSGTLSNSITFKMYIELSICQFCYADKINKFPCSATISSIFKVYGVIFSLKITISKLDNAIIKIFNLEISVIVNFFCRKTKTKNLRRETQYIYIYIFIWMKSTHSH